MKAIVATVLTAAALLQVWRLKVAVARGRALAAQARPFARDDKRPRRSVLVLGDSTGVGVGAERAADSIAGLIAAEFEDVRVVNLARSGAQLADAYATARAVRDAEGAQFDVALLHVGGNDVLHATATPHLRQTCGLLLAELRSLAGHTVWLGAANVGLSPTFLPPLSWWLTRQGRRANAVFRSAARRAGIDYVEFFAERGKDLFSSDVQRWYAADGIHPSSRSYRHCYEQIKRMTALASWLGERKRPRHRSSQGVQHTHATR